MKVISIKEPFATLIRNGDKISLEFDMIAVIC